MNENILLLLSGFENTQKRNHSIGISHVRQPRTKSLFAYIKLSKAEKLSGSQYSSNDILRLKTR